VAGVIFSAFNKEVDLNAGDAIKCSLHTSTYTPALTAAGHDYQNDLTNELAATGNYSLGGATCAAGAVTKSGQVVTFDAGDAVWTNLTMSAAARYAVAWADTAGASTTDPLICLVDFGGNEQTTSADFTIQWNASGVFAITAA
jgi:hypothetical protein